MTRKILALIIVFALLLPFSLVAANTDSEGVVLFSLTRTEATSIAEEGNRFTADAGVFAEQSYLTAWDNNAQVVIGTGGGAARTPIVINNNQLTAANGWASASVVGVDYASAFQIRTSTLGFDNVLFSARQKSTGSGPSAFRMAYRIGSDGGFTPIENSTVYPVRIGNDTYEALQQTYDFFPLPAETFNQEILYLRIFFDRPTNYPRNGNTSLNDIWLSSGIVDRIPPGGRPDLPEEERLVFSQEGGFFPDGFNLTLATGFDDGIIRFTTDGSDPTPQSAEFTSPIAITDRSRGPGNRLADITGISFNYFWESNGRMRETFTPPQHEILIGTVIRARVFCPDGTPLSRTRTHTYIITDNPAQFSGLPVLSLTVNEDCFFDEERGIYRNTVISGDLRYGYWGGVEINFSQRGAAWERQGDLEFFEPVPGSVGQYTTAFNQQIGVRIHGGGSRNHPQKSFRFYARDPLAQSFDHDIFAGEGIAIDGTPITSYRRFITRNFGTDWLNGSMRDALVARASRGLNFAAQDSRNAIVLLNGEFWGLYEIRDRIDEHFVVSKYNFAPQESNRVAIFENIWEFEDFPADGVLFQEMLDWFYVNRDLSDPALFAEAQRFFDLDNFIDYHIVQIYVSDHDWPQNNWRIWRYRNDDHPQPGEPVHHRDGRWRYIIQDVDYGFAMHHWDGVKHHFNDFHRMFNLDTAGGDLGNTDPIHSLFFRAFASNEEFMLRFINRFNDLMNTNLHPDSFEAIISQFEAELAPLKHMNNVRWRTNYAPGDWAWEYTWSHNVNQMIRPFNVGRPEAVRGHMLSTPELRLAGRSWVNLNLNLGNPDYGHFNLNGMNLLPGETPNVTSAASWSGRYLTGMEQTIWAVPTRGHNFTGFLVNGVPHENNPLRVTLTGNTTVTALFEECEILRGDADGDGYITANDVTMLRTFIASSQENRDNFEYRQPDFNRLNADADGNGYVNSSDVTFVRRWIAAFMGNQLRLGA